MTKAELETENAKLRQASYTSKRIADDLAADRNDASELVEVLQGEYLSERNQGRILELLSELVG